MLITVITVKNKVRSVTYTRFCKMQTFIYLMYMCSHICKSRNCKKSSLNTPNILTLNHTLTTKFPLDGNCQLHRIIYNNNILTKLDLDKGSLQSSITTKFKHSFSAKSY